MTLTAVDPMRALLLIDLQKGITATTKHSMPDVVARAAELASAFRSRGLPVVLVNVTGGGAHGRTDAQQAAKPPRVRPDGWTELTAELDPQPDDFRVTKTTWGAFHGTDLHAYLQEHGVTQVVLGGVATSIGVESTSASRLRTRLPRRAGDRRDDRWQRPGPREQHHPNFSPARRDHDDR